MSRKIGSSKIRTNTTNFDKILSVADDDVQKAFETIDDSIFTEQNGGTGTATYTTGDMLYSDSANSLDKLPISNYGYILTSNGVTPEWRSYDVGELIDIINVGKLDVITPNTTSYLLPDFSESADEDFIAYIIDGYGVLTHLNINAGTAPGLGCNVVFTVRVNGIDTALTATLSSTDTGCFNTSTYVSVSPGDIITVKAVVSTVCAAANIYIGIRYNKTVATSDFTDMIKVGKVGAVTASFDGYLLPMYAQSTTEDFPAYIAPSDGYIDHLRIYANTPPGVGEDAIITLRINSVDTALTATISDTDNTADDLISGVTVISGDKATVNIITSSGSIISDVFVIMRFSS